MTSLAPSPSPPPLFVSPSPSEDLRSSSEGTSIIANWSITDDDSVSFPSLWMSPRNFMSVESPVKHRFTFIRGYQQVGPTCGLVALYMVAEHLNVDISSQQIFELAVKKQFTTYGEMFCAKNLSSLAEEVLGSKADVVLERGDLKPKIRKALFANHFVLIPYDTDKNNEPCLDSGRKAHWAILCGIAKTRGNVFVIGRQSKSRLLSIWNLEKLVISNSNLRIPDLKVRFGSVVPSEGLYESLAEQCIVIKGK